MRIGAAVVSSCVSFAYICLSCRVTGLQVVNPPVMSPAAVGQLLKPKSVQDVEAWLPFNATDGQFEIQPYVFSIPNDW